LLLREKVSDAMKQGIVHETGLIAHGRGEAFDYLLGETTIEPARKAEQVTAAALLCATHPVISVNGNVAALAAEACASLARALPAKIEINLFHRTDERVHKIAAVLASHGVQPYGVHPTKRIPGLPHDRGWCDEEGIYIADVVLIPLEDGDRCEALRRMGKTVIAIDLNPLSRTSKEANISIVDNLLRAVPEIHRAVSLLKTIPRHELMRQVAAWDNQANLRDVCATLSKRLNALF
jgi:4-phosphopantoate--beta-alanine ligase